MGVELHRGPVDVLQHQRHQGADPIRGDQAARVLQADARQVEGCRLSRPLRVVLVGMLGRHRVNEVDDGLEAGVPDRLHLLLPTRELVPFVRNSRLPHSVGAHALQVEPVQGIRCHLEGVEPSRRHPERGVGCLFRHQPQPLEGVLLEVPGALLEEDAGHQLDGVEARLVHPLDNGQHHPGAHARGPKAHLAVPQCRVHEMNLAHGQHPTTNGGGSGIATPLRHSCNPPVIPAKQAVSKGRPSEAQTPLRHSRESGNPGGVERGNAAVAPLHHPWIPAFAGMTEGDGNDDFGGLYLAGVAF